MNQHGCILHDLADAMAEHEELRAVRLGAADKEVSFAVRPGGDPARARAAVERIVARYQPGEIPGCGTPRWTVSCELCDRGVRQPMPPGIRLERTGSGDVLIEKASCPTAPSFWKWSRFPWVRVEPRHVPAPSGGEDLGQWKRALAAAGVCGAAAVTAWLLDRGDGPGPGPAALGAYLAAYVAGGWFPAIEVWSLVRQRILDVHFLMLCVAAGAAAIGHWSEGAVLLFLFSLSGALEDLAMARTEREIRSLFREAPKEATVVGPGDEETRRPVETLDPGTVLRVRPGEQFPVDAEVERGTTAADESSLTGESLPADKGPGDTVFGGTLNTWGSVDVRVLRPAAQSALAKIITLIREAQASKAPSQRFTDRFGTGYTYAILGTSAAMFLFWWLGQGRSPFVSAPGAPSAFYLAMTLLVVASPCALVLSIPSAILAGIAAGARRGVLFRGGAAIEKLAEIGRVALDKTGTLTTGDLAVERIESVPPGREAEVLRVAAAVGHHSSHPVARAIARAARDRGAGGPIPAADGFRSLTGLGASALLRDAAGGPVEARIGRRSLFDGSRWVGELEVPGPGATETIVEAGDTRGRILLRDRVRESARPLLAQLRREGVRVTMLTGDRAGAAQLASAQLGLEDVRAELTPAGKVAVIRAWTEAGEKVAMVGDGVNDAPSLAAAHVAVGMGLRGSDAVLEQADVVLMNDRLEHFMHAFHLSRRARAIIRQNLAVSLGVIALLVASAIAGAIPLTLGVVGHEGSTVLVVLNSLRLLFGGGTAGNPPADRPA